MNLDDLKAILSAFAEEETANADLYRLQAADEPPEATGATVVFGKTDGRRFTEVHGLQGELPANIRIEEEAVLGSSPENPDDWKALEGPDGESLRVFSLLDPRTLGEQIQQAEFVTAEAGETLAVGHVDLANLPGLPEQFVKWLKGDAFDRLVQMRFVDDQLVETVQADFYPRLSDRIIARYSK